MMKEGQENNDSMLGIIKSRRSVRAWKDAPLADEAVRKIIEAGMSAPSAGNQQPWQFIVAKDKLVMQKLSECGPYARFAKDASVIIVVCGDLSLERHKGFWVQDCSAAIENMLIEVSALGLGAVWLGVYPREDRVEYLKKYFGLPEHIIPLAMVPVGYPQQKLISQDRYDKSKVHYEKW